MIPDWQLPDGVDRGLWDYVRSERVAREYDSALAGSNLLRHDIAFVRTHCPTPGTLIDLGCGTGRLIRELAPLGYACTGVDLSPTMLAVAREQCAGLSADWVEANLVELSVVSSGRFDYAACLFSTFGMIRGQDHRRRFLTEVRRLLKPTGRFIVHAHNARYHGGFGLGRRGSERGDRVMPQARGGAELTLHHFTRRELLSELARAGFDARTCQPVSAGPDGRVRRAWLFGGFRTYGYLVAADRSAVTS